MISENIYRDTGCHLAPSCLACPFPECRYKEPETALSASVRRAERDTKITDMRRQGMETAAIAVVVGTSERTVYRVTKLAGLSRRA